MTQAPWTIERVLNWTRSFFEDKGIEGGRFDAELLMADALKVDRMRLYLDHHKPLSPDELAAIRERVRRRGQREPVAYILGKKGFWSLDLNVDHRVLVPRPETEGLVERALEITEDHVELQIVDVGCGSGCIGLALAQERPRATVIGLDISEDALRVANSNAQSMGQTNIEFRKSDLLAEIVGAVDLVVSNPPYIPSATIPKLMEDVQKFEPHLALDGGQDGLDIYRRLIPQAGEKLRAGGFLIMEIGFDQKDAVTRLCDESAVFEHVEAFQDISGLDRIVRARKMG